MVTGVIEETHKGPDMAATVQKESLRRHDMVTGVTKEVPNGHDLMTGGPEEIRFRLHMATEIEEDIPYCYLGTPSGKQTKARSTSQSQNRSENTPCDNWNRPDFVGPSAVGEQQHSRQYPQQQKFKTA